MNNNNNKKILLTDGLNRGVTLIEMLVVVAIVALVSTVIIFNYSDFSNNVSVRALAQEVALGVRKAQTYATSVRNVDGTTGNSSLYPAYGISFAIKQTSKTSPYEKQFVLFADIPDNGEKVGDGVYNTKDSCGTPQFGDECAEMFNITSADKIVKLCTTTGGAKEDCFTDKAVDIVFRRPSPDANICIDSGGVCQTEKPAYVKIVIESAKGLQKTITVWNTGQISVN